MNKKRIIRPIVRKCAVCGTQSNLEVIYHWQRFSDGKIFNICYNCSWFNKVNAESVENFKGVGTKASFTDPEIFLDCEPSEQEDTPTIHGIPVPVNSKSV